MALPTFFFLFPPFLLYSTELYEYYTGSENVGPTTLEETPTIKNIVVRNVNIDGVQRYAGVIAGLPERPIEEGAVQAVGWVGKRRPGFNA